MRKVVLILGFMMYALGGFAQSKQVWAPTLAQQLLEWTDPDPQFAHDIYLDSLDLVRSLKICKVLDNSNIPHKSLWNIYDHVSRVNDEQLVHGGWYNTITKESTEDTSLSASRLEAYDEEEIYVATTPGGDISFTRFGDGKLAPFTLSLYTYPHEQYVCLCLEFIVETSEEGVFDYEYMYESHLWLLQEEWEYLLTHYKVRMVRALFALREDVIYD